MGTLIATFLASKFGIYIVGLIVALAGLVGTYLRGKHLGAAAERAKQAAEDRRAIDLHDEIQNDVRSMSEDHVRAELAKRTRK